MNRVKHLKKLRNENYMRKAESMTQTSFRYVTILHMTLKAHLMVGYMQQSFTGLASYRLMK